MDVLPHRHLSSHKQIVFLSGLPRTGSTLLTSILSQNPDIYVDGNSALERVLYGVHQTCNVVAREGLVRTYRTDFTEELLAAIPRLFYQKVTQKIIVEKDRGWGRDLFDLMKFVTSQPKILMLVRPINEIVTSFVAFRKRNGDILVEKDLLQRGRDPLLEAIENVAYALANVNENYLFGSYEQLITNPHSFLDQVCDFWQIPKQHWDLENIKNPKPENDAAFNTVGLHDVRPNISKLDYEVKVSATLMAFANQLDEALWHDYEQAKKIRPESFIA